MTEEGWGDMVKRKNLLKLQWRCKTVKSHYFPLLQGIVSIILIRILQVTSPFRVI